MEEEKELQPKKSELQPEEKKERSVYDRFVESEIAHKVIKEEGGDPEKSARVVVDKDHDGDPELHIFARSRKGVDSVANALQGRFSIRRRYVGNNVSPEDEAEAMGSQLGELVTSSPEHVVKSEKASVPSLRYICRVSRQTVDPKTGEVRPASERELEARIERIAEQNLKKEKAEKAWQELKEVEDKNKSENSKGGK